MFIIIFNFWVFGPVYYLSRNFDREIRILQKTFLSIGNDVQDGYFTT